MDIGQGLELSDQYICGTVKVMGVDKNGNHIAQRHNDCFGTMMDTMHWIIGNDWYGYVPAFAAEKL